jgi:hypothetical protein
MQSVSVSVPVGAEELAGHASCVSRKQKLSRWHTWQESSSRKNPPRHTQAEMFVRPACPSVVELAGHGAGAAEFEWQKVFTGHTEQLPTPPKKPAVHSHPKIVAWPADE